MAKWNEAEIDQIIASVEETVQTLEKSSKGKAVAINAKANGGPMKKDEKDGKKDDASAQSDAAPDAAPSADASSAAPAAQDSAAPAADAAPAASESAPGGDAAAAAPAPDAGQQGEGELEQPELSDEELHEIYGSMPHEELERHFMAIRSLLQDAYAQQDGSAAAGEAAPAPAAPDASAQAAPMGKEEKGADKKDEPMDKAEKAKLESLEKANSEMKNQIELLTKAVEAGFRPQRKSIEGIDYIRKGEADAGTPAELSKSEITEKCSKLDYGKLSKSDREAINSYMLYDDKSAKAHVEKILGGK